MEREWSFEFVRRLRNCAGAEVHRIARHVIVLLRVRSLAADEGWPEDKSRARAHEKVHPCAPTTATQLRE